MILNRSRAQELVTLLRAAAPQSKTATAIENQLKRNPSATEIEVPAAWIKQPAGSDAGIRAFAAGLPHSSFEAFRPVVPQTPFSKLPRFDAAKHWDLDSTPQFARLMSRKLGTRPPAIEAAIIMASLKHDIRYYYGGDVRTKVSTDSSFAKDIAQYGKLLNTEKYSKVVGFVDELAVAFGGVPSSASYSWGYGHPVAERAFGPLASGQSAQIEAHADAQAQAVIGQIANGTFAFTDQQKAILTPEILTQLRQLATALVAQGS